ncbi:MAG: phosphoribosylglycinamide formyltransferase [Clostridiales bacterium]|nr:phosphoribosylglycinamide formyltransferase [Clostridiales bacterium]
MLKKRIAVLVSGGGTNFKALLEAEQNGIISTGEIVLAVADRTGAYALERARAAGVKACLLDKKALGGLEKFEYRLLKLLEEEDIDLIVLAGFLSILSAEFTQHYKKRIINIHPSLIPAFCGPGYYGLKVHKEALKRGVKVSGATVHFVNDIADGGEIIAQQAVPVLPGDSPQSLQQRIMEQAEWQLLPRAVEEVCRSIND